jgi:FKBP-type peptidyl-prolyl cis-trans isomerase FklB
MTKKWLAMAVVGGLLAMRVGAEEVTAVKTEAAKDPEAQVLKSDADKISYAIGVDMAKGLKRSGLDIQSDMLARGMKDAASGGAMLMTEEEVRGTLAKLQAEMMKKQAEARKAMEAGSGEKKKEGEAFLAANKAKEGVVTLPSGLQYKIIKAGDGKKPANTDSVECNYRGTLIDGTEFDSSYKRGQPATFRVTGVIPGWTEALQLMPEGSKWQLFIPSELAYGPRGAGGAIGPNETLIFELDLLGIK